MGQGRRGRVSHVLCGGGALVRRPAAQAAGGAPSSSAPTGPTGPSPPRSPAAPPGRTLSSHLPAPASQCTSLSAARRASAAAANAAAVGASPTSLASDSIARSALSSSALRSAGRMSVVRMERSVSPSANHRLEKSQPDSAADATSRHSRAACRGLGGGRSRAGQVHTTQKNLPTQARHMSTERRVRAAMRPQELRAPPLALGPLQPRSPPATTLASAAPNRHSIGTGSAAARPPRRRSRPCGRSSSTRAP